MVSARDAKMAHKTQRETPPVFDGLIAADGNVFLSTTDGQRCCFGGKGPER